MKLIKIDRSSIRKNPESGQRAIQVRGSRNINFSVKGKFPDFLENDPDIIKTSWSEDLTEGIIIHPDKVSLFQDVPGSKISIEHEKEVIYGLPPAQYLYKYEYTDLQCAECLDHIPVKNIIHDYTNDYDEFPFTRCPKCEAIDSFEDYVLENINDVIKELKTSNIYDDLIKKSDSEISKMIGDL